MKASYPYQDLIRQMDIGANFHIEALSMSMAI